MEEEREGENSLTDLSGKVGYKCAKFYVYSFFYDDVRGRNLESVSFSLSSEAEFNPDFEQARIHTNISVLDGEPPEASVVSQIGVECDFMIEKFRKYYDSDRDVLSLPRKLLKEILSFSIDGSRGALTSRLQGTPLGDYVMPSTNVDAIVENMYSGSESSGKVELGRKSGKEA